MFFCKHQSVQQSIYTSLRFKVIPSCITLSGVNLKINCILDRPFPRWSVTIYLVPEISLQESQIGSNTRLLLFSPILHSSIRSIPFPLLLPIIESNMRRMEQRNGGCSRESSVCFMKFTLTRMREIKFTKKGGAGVRNLWNGRDTTFWLGMKSRAIASDSIHPAIRRHHKVNENLFPPVLPTPE